MERIVIEVSSGYKEFKEELEEDGWEEEGGGREGREGRLELIINLLE